jgi:SAM-dependent methyltransferase
MGLKQLVPWWAKIGAKVVLSRTHLDYGWWQRCGLFVHGQMDRPAYAYRVVMSHLERIGWKNLDGKTVLELGPGDSLATAVIARALGAERCYLSDAGAFAKPDVQTYVQLQQFLEAQGLRPPDLKGCASLDDILARCHGVYLTDGLAGLRRIPSGSVDLVFSQAVLEHVRLSEFSETQKESARVLRPDGIVSHQVDLKDHLAGALNSLRFDERTWEAEWMAQSGFYTNRLRFTEIIDIVKAAGLEPEVTEVQRWDRVPTPRAKLAARFRAMPDEELRVKQFDFLARPVPRAN